MAASLDEKWDAHFPQRMELSAFVFTAGQCSDFFAIQEHGAHEVLELIARGFAHCAGGGTRRLILCQWIVFLREGVCDGLWLLCMGKWESVS